MAEQINSENEVDLTPDSNAAQNEKSSLERIYQELAITVRDHLFSPLALLDHIASRPPGTMHAVAE